MAARDRGRRGSRSRRRARSLAEPPGLRRVWPPRRSRAIAWCLEEEWAADLVDLLALDRALPDAPPRRRSLLAAVRRAGGARGRNRRAQRARRAALRGERRRAAAAAARRSGARRALRPGDGALLAQRRGRGPAALGDRPAARGPPRSDSTGCHLVRRDDAAARGPARDHRLLRPRRPRRARLADRPALALHRAGGRLARPATAHATAPRRAPWCGPSASSGGCPRTATRSKSKARRTSRSPGAAAGPTAASRSRRLQDVWATASQSPAELSYRLHLEEPAVVTIEARVLGDSPQLWSVDGRYRAIVVPTGGREVFAWSPVLDAAARRRRARAAGAHRAPRRRRPAARHAAPLERRGLPVGAPRARDARQRRGGASSPTPMRSRACRAARLRRAREPLPAADRGRPERALDRAGGRGPGAAFGRAARSRRCCPRSCERDATGPPRHSGRLRSPPRALLGLPRGRRGPKASRATSRSAPPWTSRPCSTTTCSSPTRTSSSSFGVWIRPRARARLPDRDPRSGRRPGRRRAPLRRLLLEARRRVLEHQRPRAGGTAAGPHVPRRERLRAELRCELGLPPDQGTNLLQTNRSDAELRYWRALPGEREISFGMRGTRFFSDGFSEDVPGSGGTVILDDNFHADYWGGTGYLEYQEPLGRRTSAYARAQAGYRSFDDSPRSDNLDYSLLLGVRSLRFRNTEIDVAGGYGRIQFNSLGDQPRIMGRASLRYRLPSGWSWRLGVNHLTQRRPAGQRGAGDHRQHRRGEALRGRAHRGRREPVHHALRHEVLERRRESLRRRRAAGAPAADAPHPGPRLLPPLAQSGRLRSSTTCCRTACWSSSPSTTSPARR